MNVTEKLNFVFREGLDKHCGEKGENTSFLLFATQCFQKASFSRSFVNRDCVEKF